MVQTKNGNYAEIQGEFGLLFEYPIGITPSDIHWPVFPDNKNYYLLEEDYYDYEYDSETIYFAIKGSFTEENKIEVRNIYETNYGRLYQKI